MPRVVKPAKRGKVGSLPWLPVLCLCALVGAGCTRNLYRRAADNEVGSILKQKDQYEAWKVVNWHVYPDPRARFADPTNPNRPPMPPDDPAARDLSPNPQRPGRSGIRYIEGTGYLDVLAEWNQANRGAGNASERLQLPTLDLKIGRSKPDRQSAPPRRDPEPFLITLDQAVELGLFNSREYQNRRELLYLAALPVTEERFAFSPQFFALEQTLRERTGLETPERQHNRWRIDGEMGFTRQFATGALLLARFANRTVIEMLGDLDPRTISESTLTLDLVQPLLRGGGLAVTLEPLTQAERDLLYQIRFYARFRKEFFASIAGAGGLAGGQVPAGFEDLLAGGTLSPSAGYLPTLQRRAALAIEEQNLAHLERLFQFYTAIAEGGGLSPAQVYRVELQLLRARNSILATRQSYQDNLDRFKLQLGLPTDLPIELEEAPLANLLGLLGGFALVTNQVKDAHFEAEALRQLADVKEVRPRLRQVLTTTPLVSGTRFAAEIIDRWDGWAKMPADELIRRLNQLRRRRILLKEINDELTRLRNDNQLLSPEQIAALKEFYRQQASLGVALAAIGASPAAAPLPPVISAVISVDDPLDELDHARDPERFQQALQELDFRIEIAEFELALREYEMQPWVKQPVPLRRDAEQRRSFDVLLGRFDTLLIEARNQRVTQVTERWPDLPSAQLGDLDLLTADEDEAMTAVAREALQNRFDLMNERARVVDAWRQIAVTANALLGVFNVRYRGETLTPLDEALPLHFGGRRQRHQLFLNAELPLVRKVERNLYRAALLNFQRARRTLMAAEDRILTDVRRELRQLRVIAENYRIQKRAVYVAYGQVESLLNQLQSPPPLGVDIGTVIAQQTEQLLSALNSLAGEQNRLIGTWVNYYITRLQLYRDLERMLLDSRGVWIDESAPRQPRTEPDPDIFDPGSDWLPPPRRVVGP